MSLVLFLFVRDQQSYIYNENSMMLSFDFSLPPPVPLTSLHLLISLTHSLSLSPLSIVNRLTCFVLLLLFVGQGTFIILVTSWMPPRCSVLWYRGLSWNPTALSPILTVTTLRSVSRPFCRPFPLFGAARRSFFHSTPPVKLPAMTQIERITEHLEKPELDDRSYRVIRLPNQLEALLVHDPDTDKASAAVNVNVGNFSDEDDMPGMAHAVEHLLFMGTKKVSREVHLSTAGWLIWLPASIPRRMNTTSTWPPTPALLMHIPLPPRQITSSRCRPRAIRATRSLVGKTPRPRPRMPQTARTVQRPSHLCMALWIDSRSFSFRRCSWSRPWTGNCARWTRKTRRISRAICGG